MPKIEIELREIELLNADIKRKNEEIKRLEEKLKKLDENELVKRAYQLAIKIFSKYQLAVFNKLGFSNTEYKYDVSGCVSFEDEYYTKLFDSDWYNHTDKFSINVEAYVTAEFRTAFLKIGVLAPVTQLSLREDRL